MRQHSQKLSAIFPHQTDARAAYEAMKAVGFSEQQLFRVNPGAAANDRETPPDRRILPNTIVAELLTAAGVAEDGQTAEPNPVLEAVVTVFMSEPVLRTLATAGYEAATKSMVGRARPLPLSKKDFVTVAKDAARHGFCTLVAHARDPDEATSARLLMSTLVGEETPT